MKKVLLCISIIVLFWGCSSTNTINFQSDNEYNQYIKEYQKSEIDSIIQHHDYTIIFGWTEWCKASHHELKKHILSFLAEKPDNIAVISICCANADTLAKLLEENDYKYPVYLLANFWAGLDKVKLNRCFRTLFNNYKSANYVPVVLLCNTQKEILNWDMMNNCYHGIDYSIWQIRNSF